MIEVHCAQNSPEWFAHRRGVPSASQSHRIVKGDGTPATAKVRGEYIDQLLGERFSPPKKDGGYQSGAMKDGHAFEPQARAFAGVHFGVEFRTAGFVFGNEGRRFGCSPDGLAVGGGSGLEIKTLEPKQLLHVARTRSIADYVGQIQFCIYCVEVWRWYFIAFSPCPDSPRVPLLVEADSKAQAAYVKYVPDFCDELDEETRKISKAYGVAPVGLARAL